MAISETLNQAYQAEKQEETSVEVMTVKRSQQELEDLTDRRNYQTALDRIYSFLISQTKEHLPNFPNVDFSRADEVIKQMASDNNFGNLIKSRQLSQDQLEEVWQAISPLIPAKSLSFYEWSTSELESFVQEAQRELEQRQQESLTEDS